MGLAAHICSVPESWWKAICRIIKREVLEQEYEKNGDAVKVLKLEQVPKMKHFSIPVLVGGNGYFSVRPFVAQRWGPVSRLPFLCKHKRNTSALPPQAAFLA